MLEDDGYYEESPWKGRRRVFGELLLYLVLIILVAGLFAGRPDAWPI